jgi:glycerol-3-phosphate dehydrogenase
MNRQDSLNEISTVKKWDVIVIGGGATGLGIALDATNRGFKTLLIEKGDFSNGTSSKSTKLVHGGVRYLKQFHFKLVFEAIRERKIILKNAPHLSNTLPFVIPVYSYFNLLYYSIGLFLYELLAGFGSNIGKTKLLSKKTVLESLPFIKSKKLKGGILYYDAQFNDSQLCIDIATKATEKKATIINYFECVNFIKHTDKAVGIKCLDLIAQKEHSIIGEKIINATGVFSDSILQLDTPSKANIIQPSKGVHLVLNDTSNGGTKFALMSPIKQDDRIIFLIPWMGKLLLGTTDTKVEHISSDPETTTDDINYLIDLYNSFSDQKIDKRSVVSMFAGLRPLIKLNEEDATALISREHSILTSTSGIITIAGGKWTTYRKMAEDVVNLILSSQNKTFIKCITQNISLDPSHKKSKIIESYLKTDAFLAEKIHTDYSFTKAEVLYAIQYEMATTVEDILARRNRLLFLDAKASIEAAKEVAKVFALYDHKDELWISQQILKYSNIALKYIPQ